MKPLGLDSKTAVTIFSSVVIPRNNFKETLSEIDLENYVSQAIWKFFDRHRKEAAKRLRANEIDLVLNEARVVGVKIDGHRVLNPQGFTGKEVEICLGGTIMKREDVEEGTPAFESGTLRAYLLSRENDFQNALYVEVFDDLTRIFLYTPRYASFLDEFEWGKKHLIGPLASTFSVYPEVAEQIYTRYLQGEVSSRVSKVISDLFDSSFINFLNGIEACINNFKNFGLQDTKIFVKSFPLPEGVYRKHFALGKGKTKILMAEERPTEDLIENHIYNVYSDLNLLAKRRLKWLISSSI